MRVAERNAVDNLGITSEIVGIRWEEFGDMASWSVNEADPDSYDVSKEICGRGEL